MVEQRGQEVERRCLRTAGDVEELAARVRRLPPQGWSGPAATAAAQALLASSRQLDSAADALRRAALAARRLGSP